MDDFALPVKPSRPSYVPCPKENRGGEEAARAGLDAGGVCQEGKWIGGRGGDPRDGGGAAGDGPRWRGARLSGGRR